MIRCCCPTCAFAELLRLWDLDEEDVESAYLSYFSRFWDWADGPLAHVEGAS